MKSKEYISLNKMIQYIDKALEYIKNIDFEHFSNNEEKVFATVFAISQIGELVKNISNETMKKYDNIEWVVIKSLRNKIVHDYDGVKLNLIWDILNNDIMELKNDIKLILSENKNEE